MLGGGGRGQWSLYVFFNAYRVVKNQHFQRTLLGGRGHKKEYPVYAFDNADNYGLPLTLHNHCRI